MATLTVAQVAAQGMATRPAFSVPWRTALMQYADLYTSAANETEYVQPCMLAAIVDRESNGVNEFQIGVPPGNPNCGVGLCQITYNVNWANIAAPTFPGFDGSLMDPAVNLTVSAKAFLEPAIEAFPGNHLAAFAAYNAGIGAVQKALHRGANPDTVTTNNDYGHDVFMNWINFTAASLGCDVLWSVYQWS